MASTSNLRHSQSISVTSGWYSRKQSNLLPIFCSSNHRHFWIAVMMVANPCLTMEWSSAIGTRIVVDWPIMILTQGLTMTTISVPCPGCSNLSIVLQCALPVRSFPTIQIRHRWDANNPNPVHRLSLASYTVHPHIPTPQISLASVFNRIGQLLVQRSKLFSTSAGKG